MGGSIRKIKTGRKRHFAEAETAMYCVEQAVPPTEQRESKTHAVTL